MTVLAAAATGSGHIPPWLFVLGAVALIVIWLVDLYFKPYTSCGRCKGSAKRGNASRYGRCPRCKGKPERLRFGARMLHRNISGK